LHDYDLKAYQQKTLEKYCPAETAEGEKAADTVQQAVGMSREEVITLIRKNRLGVVAVLADELKTIRERLNNLENYSETSADRLDTLAAKFLALSANQRRGKEGVEDGPIN